MEQRNKLTLIEVWRPCLAVYRRGRRPCLAVYMQSRRPCLAVYMRGRRRLTLTFQPLLGQPPQQGAAVLAEGGALVVVHLEAVRHVDLEAFLMYLQNKNQSAARHNGQKPEPEQNQNQNQNELTMVSLLFTADPVHLAMTLSMHFLWMAALHSGRHTETRGTETWRTPPQDGRLLMHHGKHGDSRLHW